jgi:cob(I)alamin adenosyltransferase
MSPRLSRIITRTGDAGETGLADGSRRNKSDTRIESMGELDELNALIGLAIQAMDSEDHRQLLLQIQHDLFDLGAELCQPGKSLIDSSYPDALEQLAASLNDRLPPLEEFILPGGSEALARIHLARAVCRRAERALVRLATAESVNPQSLIYLNRLSDLLFLLGRDVAFHEAVPEVCWQPGRSRRR